ncbi:MAG: biotin/lipoyl-binding protein [Vicinamibacteria bacterium]|jgi:biotin carboxyl carrier protein|nr:biotin/lipoyl-binding protein [Vicinamibacteria bacterium]
MSQHVLRIAGREYRAEVKDLSPERATVVVDGVEYAVDLVQLGRRAVEAVRPVAAAVPPPAAAPAATAPAPAAPPAPAASRPAAATRGEGGVVAPMPGLVLKIHVREGDAVSAGQTLLVMEAMKMENAVASAYAGTVARVYVREGDAIAEGDLLVQVSRPQLTTL